MSMLTFSFILILVSSAHCLNAFSMRNQYKRYNSLHVNKNPLEPYSTRDKGIENFQSFLQKVTVIGSAILAASKVTNAAAYLVEPTDDFKEEQARIASFSETRLKIRKDWDTIMKKFESTNESLEMEQLLKDMKQYLIKIEDMPTGVKKREIVKLCRSKKFNGRKVKPNWTTNVEIAYEALIQEINRRLVPVNSVSNNNNNNLRN
jgi:hypothetical protein